VSTPPLVSIVTPTLNQAAFIDATIRSVVGQTYSTLEHVIVDAGSTDGTIDILRAYEGRYPMRWRSEPDAGMYDGVNKGMRESRGKILCYLNSDDVFLPWTLEVVVDAFAEHPEADFVIGDAIGLVNGNRHELRFQPVVGFSHLLHAGSYIQPAVFWRRSIFDAGLEFDPHLRLAGDLDFWLRATRGRAVARVDEFVVLERDHEGTKRATQREKLLAESWSAREQAGVAPGIGHDVNRVAGRFRAWLANRRTWFRFARAARGRRLDGDPWGRTLAGGKVVVRPLEFALAQVPWFGKRFRSRAVSLTADWSVASVAVDPRASLR
jgi:glycosyltransferase involved in cell wall biosynthesis